MSNDERWIPIPGSEIYSMSSWGRLRNNRSQRIKKLFPNKYGTLIVVISNNSGVGSTSHNITKFMRLFMPPQPTPQHAIFHLDGDKTNNHVDNLAWMTNQERIKRGYKKNIRHSKGFQPQLTLAEKRIISTLWNKGISQVKIGKTIGRSNSTVSKYIRGV